MPWRTIDGEAVAVVRQSDLGGFPQEELPKGFSGISKLPLASAVAFAQRLVERNERHPEGEDFPAKGVTELEVLIQGIFDKRRFLEQVLHLIVFEENGTSISKKLLRRPFCTTQYPKKSSCQAW
ncbi:hypothetical protein [Nostoc sp. CHAB 5715]|uniref:hypothetical protein n=1 Tax=Nostoc sp. CHAB 5715 TaxID=2780400 RepID=UPI001E3FA40E|nr:hypothetical protein [Nostoc sp. CHAB 5715]MCC5621269.1 hypothetical protein [Nostoc sp. CHAB 5715]